MFTPYNCHYEKHLSSIHILQQKHKLDCWLECSDSMVVANCILILCNRLARMLSKQIVKQLDTFCQEGGFTEALTAERLVARAERSVAEGAPLCPKCGKSMVKRMTRKGINYGKEYWSCSAYPNCNGTRSVI